MKTNKKKAFLMYLDSLEPISLLDDGQAGRLLRAIVAYQSEDDVALERLKEEQIVGVVFSRIEKYFEENEEKYERICRVRRESGKKGGLIKASRDTKQKVASAKQKVAKRSMIDDNDNIELSTNVSNSTFNNTSVCVERGVGETCSGETVARSPEYIKFQTWIEGNCPYCSNPKNMAQITEAEYLRLLNPQRYGYTFAQVVDTVSKIENRKDLRKRYDNLYRTALNWLKRDYGKN